MNDSSRNDDLFENFTRGLSEFGRKVGSFVDDVFSGEGTAGEVRVKTDIYQTKEFYVIEMELPGMKKEEVSIQIHEGILQVKGNKQANHPEDAAQYEKRERAYGPFLKSIELPADLEVEKPKAKYELGVLTIRFPRPLPQTAEAGEDETNVDIE